VTRQCGPCSACCTVLEVAAISKPGFAQCPNQEGGCSVYEQRPAPCMSYRCHWLDGQLAEDERPDLVGLIFDSGLSPLFKMWGADAIVARETAPGTAQEPRAARLIQKRASEGNHVFVRPFSGGDSLVTRDSEMLKRVERERERFRL